MNRADTSPYLLPLVHIFRRAAEAGRRSFLLTSHWPDEGKTTLAVELSAMLANPDYTVLLVDGDGRRPTLSRHFGYRGGGLPAVLRGDSAPLDTHAPGLSVLGSPTVSTGIDVPPSGVARFRQLASRHSLTLVDSPPLSACSDALTLASLCDAVLLVISARSYRGVVEGRTMEEFKRHQVPVEGLILTRHDQGSSPRDVPASLLGRLGVWLGIRP